VLLMVPLKMLIVGIAWQLGLTVLFMAAMLAAAYAFLHKVRIPVAWPWVLGYAAVIAGVSEIVTMGSKLIDESVPIHIEVLLPAFALGAIMAYPRHGTASAGSHHAEIETPAEKRVTTLVAAVFMVLVGLSMPKILSGDLAGATAMSASVEPTLHAAGAGAAESAASEIGGKGKVGRVTAAQPPLGWLELAFHVLIITILANLGKMFPAFCYRREAHWRERLAVAVGMWPRGEVGAGVLVISLSYGIGGPVVTVAMLSLALNLLLTGMFIYFVRRLTFPLEAYSGLGA
jgi:hypothetical protein